MKTVYFLEAIKNIRKNLMTSTLLVACFIVLFCLFAWVSANAFLAGYATNQAETIQAAEYSCVTQSVLTMSSPRIISSDLQTRPNEEIYNVGIAMDSIINDMTKRYNALKNYYIKYIQLQNYDGKTEGIYVCPDMYEINKSTMIFSEGSFFEKSDFNKEIQIEADYIMPTVIGSKFAETYSLNVGDVFYPDMLMDENSYEWRQWRVVGILEYDSSFIKQNSLENTNYKAFIPDTILPSLSDVLAENNGEINENVLNFICGDLFMYFRNVDFYLSSDVIKEAVEFEQKIISENSFLNNYYKAIEDPTTTVYIAEQQTKSKNFYMTVSIITYIVSCFGIVMSISNKIQNNLHNYSIHLLNGATVFDLILCSITEIFILLLSADILFTIPYFLFFSKLNMGNNIYIARSTPLFVLTVNIVTLIIAAAVSFIKLIRFDAVGHLKTKE